MTDARGEGSLEGAQPALVPLCDWSITLEPAQLVPSPFGLRTTYVIRAGRCTGERLRGRFLPGGGDWVLLGPDGVGRLDVRATLETHDGALIHVTSLGVASLPPAAAAQLAAGELVPWDAMHVRSTPRFETADERYAWLNAVVAVAVNDLGPNTEAAHHVGYRLWELR